MQPLLVASLLFWPLALDVQALLQSPEYRGFAVLVLGLISIAEPVTRRDRRCE